MERLFSSVPTGTLCALDVFPIYWPIHVCETKLRRALVVASRSARRQQHEIWPSKRQLANYPRTANSVVKSIRAVSWTDTSKRCAMKGENKGARREGSRRMKFVHLSPALFLERITKCRYNRIGCPWRGPYHEHWEHEKVCTHPHNTGAQLVEVLDAMDKEREAERKMYDSIFDLLSCESMQFHGRCYLVYLARKTDMRTKTFGRCYFSERQLVPNFHFHRAADEYLIRSSANEKFGNSNLRV